MGTLRNVIIAILAISFLTFVAFFGRLPAFRNTPIGFLHRILWIHIPNLLRNLDVFITGGRTSQALRNFGHYLFNRKHPLVLILFLILLTGSALLFLSETWTTLPIHHKLWTAVLLPQPYIYTYLCASSRQEYIINPANVLSYVAQYPYDAILFHPNHFCRTCHLPKPARSKHCRLCGHCVARADHHCIWVNNCVGLGNYKFFLLLLISMSVLLFYGAYLSYITLYPQVAAHIAAYPRFHARIYDRRQDWFGRSVMRRMEAFIDELGTAFMIGGISVGAVGFLASLTAPMPLGLLGYHVYLIWAGMTTNETGKWADLKDDMKDGFVWVCEVEPRENDLSATDKIGSVRAKKMMAALRTDDGMPPDHSGRWRRCWKLREVENIYDLGFWENLKEILTN